MNCIAVTQEPSIEDRQRSATAYPWRCHMRAGRRERRSRARRRGVGVRRLRQVSGTLRVVPVARGGAGLLPPADCPCGQDSVQLAWLGAVSS